MKLLTVIGARPQFIKAAVVSRAIARHNENARPSRLIQEIIVHTGQHYDHNMSALFFDEMQIPRPDYFLDIHGLSHGAMTGQMLERVEEIMLQEKPDLALVYGDTNTTAAGALAAAKLHIRTAHVEAGLRSYNRRMPEEINRVVTDHVSTWLFHPTERAEKNLAAEGIVHESDAPALGQTCVFHSGDVMLDAAMFYGALSAQRSRVMRNLEKNHDISDSFVLATVHRAENTDDPARLAAIFASLGRISRDTPVVVPIHPRTRRKLAEAGMDPAGGHPGLVIMDPVGYFDMLELIKHCRLVMTDSGGLQKEACFFRQPCITLREETEWVELVEQGGAMLAGAGEESILAAYEAMKNRDAAVDLAQFGGGKAGKRIVDVLAKA